MPDFTTFSIQSGSNGNCIYVEAGGVRLLFDAGVNARTVKLRMAEHARSPYEVDALIISHDHSDHVRCAGIYQRMFRVPMYISRRTYDACAHGLGRTGEIHFFTAGQTFDIGAARIHSVRTPHDAADGVIFIVEHETRRLGIFTDLGHPFTGLDDLIAEVDAAYLESNYDTDMLETGPYPWFLKQRIAGLGGHISNAESADLVRRAANGHHRWIALSHLSEENNDPALCLETHQSTVGHTFPYELSSRTTVSPLRTV